MKYSVEVLQDFSDVDGTILVRVNEFPPYLDEVKTGPDGRPYILILEDVYYLDEEGE